MYKIIILFTLSPLIRSCNAAVLFQAAFLGWLDPRDMQLPTPPTLPWVRVCFPRHQDIPPISTGDHLALFPVHTRRLSPARVKLKPRNVYHLQTTLQTTVEYVLIVKVNCWCCYANTHVKTWENIHTDVFIINVSCVYIMNNYNICYVKSKGF